MSDWQAWMAEHLVPRFMRRWPILRRWYWQPEDLAEVRRRAHERAERFRRYTDDG